MGLNNYIQQKILKSEAKKLADWAAKQYPVVKAQNRHSDEREIYKLMWLGDLSLLARKPTRTIEKIDTCCSSINGLCYLLGMEFGVLKGALAFRCHQFTEYMDNELLARGFTAQSPDTKRKILSALALGATEPSPGAAYRPESELRSVSIGGGQGGNYVPTADDYKKLQEYTPQVRDFFVDSFKDQTGTRASRPKEERPWVDLSKIKAPEIKDSALIAINEEGRFRLEDWQPTTQEEALPPTDAQVTFLQKNGLSVKGWQAGYASRVIDIVVRRSQQGLATPKQVRFLLKNGYPKAHSMTFEDARTAMDALLNAVRLEIRNREYRAAARVQVVLLLREFLIRRQI